MSYVSSYKGFDLFTQENQIKIKLDTPDGMVPVGSSYSSVEIAQEAIDQGFRPNQEKGSWLRNTMSQAIAK